jgi:hypothetical protein
MVKILVSVVEVADIGPMGRTPMRHAVTSAPRTSASAI